MRKRLVRDGDIVSAIQFRGGAKRIISRAVGPLPSTEGSEVWKRGGIRVAALYVGGLARVMSMLMQRRFPLP